jgi:hypothetical protein
MDDTFAQLRELARDLPEEPTEALVHIRALYQRISELAVTAAEERWPGFEALTKKLIAKEVELQQGRA